MMILARGVAVALAALELVGGQPSRAADSSILSTSSRSVENRKIPASYATSKSQVDAGVDGNANIGATRPASINETTAAKPTFSLAAGRYVSTQSVTLTDVTPGFVMHYTTTGAAPTAASPQYNGPISVASSKTIKAIAVAAGYTNSAVASAAYEIAAAGIVATPASLVFPVTSIGSRAVSKVVTIKNTDHVAVTSLSITLVGAATSAYSKSQTCGTTLGPGASCTVSIVFNPNTSGHLAAAVRVTGNGSRSASVSVEALCTDVSAQTPNTNSYEFNTSQGNIYVALRPDVAPINVANFLHYVNNGTYAQSIIHRVVAQFVVQGGGYKVNSAGEPIMSPTAPAVVNEFKLPNVRGTLAMAKTGTDPNSATDQFFFNVANNTALNTQSGGSTVIGQIIGVQGVVEATQSAGLAVLDAINSDKVYKFDPPFESIPLLNYTSGATVKPENLVYIHAVTQVMPKTGAPATPVFSIKAGTYKGPQSIRLKDSTPGAAIYYYLLGAKSRNVSKYTKPFTVSKSQYVCAYAMAPGYLNASSLNYEYFGIAAQ